MSSVVVLDKEDVDLAFELLVENTMPISKIAEYYRVSSRGLVRAFDSLEDESRQACWRSLRSSCVGPLAGFPVPRIPTLSQSEIDKEELQRENKGSGQRSRIAFPSGRDCGGFQEVLAERLEAIRLCVEEGWPIERACKFAKATEVQLQTASKHAPITLRTNWNNLRAKLKAERARVSVRAACSRREAEDPDVQKKKTEFFAALASGMSIEKAGKAARVSVGIGKRWRREAGITKRQSPGSPEAPAYKDALDILAQGQRYISDVADEFGLNPAELRRKCRDRKIEFRKEKSGPKKMAICESRHPRWREGVERVRDRELPKKVAADIGISCARLKEWCLEEGVDWVQDKNRPERHLRRDETVAGMFNGRFFDAKAAARFAGVSAVTVRGWYRNDIGQPYNEKKEVTAAKDKNRHDRHPKRDEAVAGLVNGRFKQIKKAAKFAGVSKVTMRDWYAADIGELFKEKK